MPKAKVLLKEELFNKNTVSKMSRAIKNIYTSLDEESFIDDIIFPFDSMELKERIYWISEMLRKYLPDSFKESVSILLESLKGIEEEGIFVFSAYSDFVSKYGCSKEYLDLSLEMLGEFTKMFSSEFAIRSFINQFPDTTINKMIEWSLSDNVHQRRLSSEGLRPKLPWAKGISFDIEQGIIPLENLFYDNERYVTRSVANHLNDISKINPMLVLSLLSKWKESKRLDNKEMDYIIAHSLRTLIKKGHKETLEFLGYSYSPKIEFSNFSIKDTNIKIGDSIEFSFEITAKGKEHLVIDYIVDYPMLNKRKSSKVFKIKKVLLHEGNNVKIIKKHAFRVMTTKKLYSGEYSLVIQINVKKFGTQKFNLTI